MKQDSRITIGVDIGDRWSWHVGLTEHGEVVQEGRVRTTLQGVERYFSSLPPARVVLEVGTHSWWMSRKLAEVGHEVVVANPRQVRLIFSRPTKSDRMDAETLARLGRLDPELLAPIQHRGREAQLARSLVRTRTQLIRQRTDAVNHVRSTVKVYGGRLPSCSTPSFAKKMREHLPEALVPILAPMLDVIEGLTKLIRSYDRKIEELAAECFPETERLRQVDGVGVLTALYYVATVEDPRRFDKSRRVGSFVGLRPRLDQSGDRNPQLHITKAGDPMVRWLLGQCAHHILGPRGKECDLRRWGHQYMERGGKTAKKKALVAVARKLSVLLHRLWQTGESYDPLRQARAEERRRKAASA